MKPTHLLKTRDGSRYLVDLSDPNDLKVITNVFDGNLQGTLKITFMVEDPNWNTEKRYKEKVAIVLCRELTGLDEV